MLTLQAEAFLLHLLSCRYFSCSLLSIRFMAFSVAGDGGAVGGVYQIVAVKTGAPGNE